MTPNIYTTILSDYSSMSRCALESGTADSETTVGGIQVGADLLHRPERMMGYQYRKPTLTHIEFDRPFMGCRLVEVQSN